MRSPSSRCLVNRVDVYPVTAGQDVDGRPQYTYSTAPTRRAVPCSVQGLGAGEEVDELGRVTPVNGYDVMFGVDPGLTSRDKLVWTDVSPARILFVQGSSPSQAGRESAWVLAAIERL